MSRIGVNGVFRLNLICNSEFEMNRALLFLTVYFEESNDRIVVSKINFNSSGNSAKLIVLSDNVKREYVPYNSRGTQCAARFMPFVLNITSTNLVLMHLRAVRIKIHAISIIPDFKFIRSPHNLLPAIQKILFLIQ